MRNAPGYRAVVVCLLGVLAGANPLVAADLHFIALAETQDPSIGTDVDLQKAKTWAQMISSDTGLTLQYYQLSGENLTTSHVRALLRSVSPGSDDVVYFTYSGHGANLGESKWPSFTFMTGDVFDFTEVVGILQPKQQRLLVVLADCCNVSISSGRPTPLPDPAAQSAQTIAGFQKLFLEFRGAVAASSSSLGQYSLGEQGEGGLFVNAFMDNFLAMAASVPDLTWQAVLAAATTDTQQQAARYGENQKPQYSVNTEQVAADTPTPPGGDGTGSDGTGGSDSGDVSQMRVPACGPMMPLPLALAFWAWIMKRRARSGFEASKCPASSTTSAGWSAPRSARASGSGTR